MIFFLLLWGIVSLISYHFLGFWGLIIGLILAFLDVFFGMIDNPYGRY